MAYLPKVPSNTRRLEQPIDGTPSVGSPRRHRGGSPSVQLYDHVLVIDSAESVHERVLVGLVHHRVVLTVVRAHSPRRAGDKVPEAAAVDVEVLGLGDALVKTHAALRCVSVSGCPRV